MGSNTVVRREATSFFIDIAKHVKEMYVRDSRWLNLAYRVSASDLTENEMDLLIVAIEAMLGEFLRQKGRNQI
jgi:hypothetical protein